MAGDASQQATVTYEDLKNSKFYSQTLSGYMPMFSPKWTICTFFLVGPIFAGIGIALWVSSDNVVEVGPVRYDSILDCAPAGPCMDGSGVAPAPTPTLGPDDPSYVPQDPLCWRRLNETEQLAQPNVCTQTITIEKDMKQPVFFYYQITNFYQNQRVYVKSQAPFQLKGGPDAGKWDSKQAYSDALKKACIDSVSLARVRRGAWVLCWWAGRGNQAGNQEAKQYGRQAGRQVGGRAGRQTGSQKLGK